MAYHTFTEMARTDISSLKLTLEDYQHTTTGARHLHFATDDPHKVFLVAFLTVPQDSTGVAHILEHTALCGSRNFPIRDPFFMMTRRSLNTFMNAFTSGDWTAYPFATLNHQDFDNLLQVYLDAAFFPNLHALDFAQEGHRLEFATPDDPNSELVYKGVVYNEMKGAMSSPLRQLHHTIQAHLFPTTTYHYNSGGEPSDIPNLTHEQLKNFHATHYHPSNAIFMTYGDQSATELQERFEALALQHFQKLAVNLQVPDEQRYSEPQIVTGHYPLDDETNTRDKTHIVIAWLLGRNSDIQTFIHMQLISGVLLDNSASPLLHALETTELGTAPSPLCGVDESSHEMGFYCGLEGSNPEQAEAVEALIMQVLQQIATQGVPQEQVEAVLHQIELHQREVSGDGFPYGLGLMLQALTSTVHGGDPVAVLNIDPILAQLRIDCQDPQFIPKLITQHLLNNPHRVRVTVSPDPELSAQQEAAQTAKLAELKKQLSEAAQQQIMQLAADLQQRQDIQDDPEGLPKVTLADVPEELVIPEGAAGEIAGMPAMWFARGTNGLVYESIVLSLPQLSHEELQVLPILCDCLPEVGCAGQDYLQTAERQAQISGGISVQISQRGNVHEIHDLNPFVRFSSKALNRNQAAMSQLLRDTLETARFDELSRLRELIAQMRADADHRVTQRGHTIAMAAAASGLSPSASLSHRWAGAAGIQFIRQLDNKLDSDSELQQFAQQLTALRDKIIHAPRQLLVVAEAEEQTAVADSLSRIWETDSDNRIVFNAFQALPVRQSIQQAWTTTTQVNFCAKVYPTVPVAHPDAATFLVLGSFLRNGFLHPAIREKGGAYGGGAGYDGSTGTFRFYSYRDPRLVDTLTDFDNALDWLQTTAHPERTLEESILSVISSIDRPGSPAGEAITAFFNQLHGRTPEQRRTLRERVLNVQIEDLQRVAVTYLQPERANTVVLSSTQILDNLNGSLKLTRQAL